MVWVNASWRRWLWMSRHDGTLFPRTDRLSRKRVVQILPDTQDDRRKKYHGKVVKAERSVEVTVGVGLMDDLL